ncbi:MAG: YhdT family protein [Coriobacteriales bacterium]
MQDKKTYGAKLRQCNREALITVVTLALTIAVWALLGFGLSGVDARICGIPLWAVAGTVGTWVFAIAVSVVLSKKLFCDFDVEEGDEDA